MKGNERLIMLIPTDGVKTLINLYVNGVFAPHVWPHPKFLKRPMQQRKKDEQKIWRRHATT